MPTANIAAENKQKLSSIEQIFTLAKLRLLLLYRRIPLASPGFIHAHFGDLVG